MIPTKPDPTTFEEDLLRELRIERPADEGARERVASRLGFAALAPDIAEDGPRLELASENAATSAASHAVALAGSRVLGLASLTFVLGAAAGVAGQAWLDAPEVRIIYLERPAPRAVSVSLAPSSERAPLASSAPPLATVRAVRVPASASAASVPSVPSVPSSGGTELGPEVTLLDRARKAMSEQRYARAFELLGSHARLFPSSVLEQEREALTIKALVATGRSSEARSRAQRFRARFPRSMHLDSIEKALATIP